MFLKEKKKFCMIIFLIISLSLIKDTIFENYNEKVLSITNTKSELQILNCLFSLIVSNGDGGAIFFSSSINGKSYLSKNCFYSCSTPNGYGFAAFIYTNLNNTCNLLSLVFCSRNTELGHVGAIHFEGGIQNMNYINSSHSQAQYYSGISLKGSSNCSLLYSTFINNFALYWVTICFYYYSLNFAENLNIINNSQNGLSWGIISNYYHANSYMKKCIFDKNTNLINKYLFASDGGIFEISNCWIQSNILFYSAQIISSFSITNTFQINFFNTKICKGEIFDFSKKIDFGISVFSILYFIFFF